MIYILLPIYNEEESLALLLSDLIKELNSLNQPYEIICVNDGSTDKSFEILTSFKNDNVPITIISHKINRGLGETIRDGWEYVAEKCSDDDVLIRMDADNTHHPKYIHDLLKKINNGCDVVTCSRFQPGGGMKGLDGYRTFISKCANLYMKIFFYIKDLWEYSCGYRAYKGLFVKKTIEIFGNSFIDLKGLGFTVTLEKLVKMRMLGAKVGAIPFVLYYNKKLSQSKMITSITTLGYIILTIKYFKYWGETGKKWKKLIAEFKNR